MASTTTIKSNQKDIHLAISRVMTVATGNQIYAGWLVGIDSNGKAIVADTTHRIVGVAFNGRGGGHQDLEVKFNHIVLLNLPSVTEADKGKTVYAVDNDTVTLTPNMAIVGQIVSVDITNGKIFVHLTLCCLTTGGGLVDSVFGRTGDVVAAASDYDASQVDNDSSVTGATVKDALETLDSNGSKNTIYFKVESDANLGNHRGQAISGTGAFRFEFEIPFDFQSIDKLVLRACPGSGAAGTGKNIDLFSDYMGTGELFNIHTESDTTSTYDTGVADTLFELDISGVFSSVQPLDLCGILVDHNSVGGTIYYLSIQLEYTRT